MRTKICNRTTKDSKGHERFVLPDDGWYHIEVTGEHPNREAGIVQVIDVVAVDSIVKNFDPGETGMLIDIDHFSHDMDKSTEAYGWLMDVKNRGGQLYGKIRWTDTGEAAVTGGRFRLFSSEYDPDSLEMIGNRRARPMRLDGLTLTNRPNNKGGVPISNREQSGGGNGAGAPNKKANTMKKTAEALGLPETASESEVLAKITELNTNTTTLTNRVKELEGDLEKIHNREVDDLMEKHTKVIGDDADSKAFWRDNLVKNREVAIKQLEAMAKTPATEDRPRVHNRKTAKTPAPVSRGDEVEKEGKRLELVESIRNRESVSFERAWEIARRKNPALFN